MNPVLHFFLKSLSSRRCYVIIFVKPYFVVKKVPNFCWLITRKNVNSLNKNLLPFLCGQNYCSFMSIIVRFIPRFGFWSKRKNKLSFSGKMRIFRSITIDYYYWYTLDFYTENKQTGQLIFSFLVTYRKTKKGMNQIYATVFNNFVVNYREQLAIADFAKSLLVIPKTLSVNAAQDSSDLVAKLR